MVMVVRGREAFPSTGRGSPRPASERRGAHYATRPRGTSPAAAASPWRMWRGRGEDLEVKKEGQESYEEAGEAAGKAGKAGKEVGEEEEGEEEGQRREQYAQVSTAGRFEGRVEEEEEEAVEDEQEEEEEEEVEDDINSVGGGGASGEADPVTRRDGAGGTSHFKGVSWHKGLGKWQVVCKGKWLGSYATEEAAAQAYDSYARDGVNPVKHREGRGLHSSTFQLNLSALYGIGRARRSCVVRVKGVLGGV